MRIKKAVITAAGQNQRALPLQTLIDRDGAGKVRPLHPDRTGARRQRGGDLRGRLARRRGPLRRRPRASYAPALRFVPQPEPRGYGNAIWCAREFTGADPFLHMVGDHLYVSAGAEAVAPSAWSNWPKPKQCSVSGVQPTRESLLPRFGTVAGRRVAGPQRSYRVETVIEKPTPTEAEQRLMVPGMRAGYYLCFFGMHVLTPRVMELLAQAARPRLSAALAELARHEQYLALEDDGRRYDLGARYGLLIAQLALALNGQDRAQVLSQMLELLADREMRAAAGERASEPAHRRHHRQRRGAQPLAGRPLPRAAARRAAGRVRRRSTASAAPATTSTNASARSSSSTPSTASTFPLRAGRRHARAASPSPATPTCSSAASKRPSISSSPRRPSTAPAPPSPARWPPAISSLAFQTLADQVRRSVRSVRGNQWMFRTGHPADYPLRLRPELLRRRRRVFPILREATPVRMDLTHSGWSDIFFLGMDFPEGARVLNISIDLAVARRADGAPKPPVEAYFRVIDQPVLRLASVDLQRHRRHHLHRRSLRFRARLPGPAEGRRDRLRHRAARHGRRHASRSPTCSRGSPAGPATASKSSAR